MFNIAFAEMLVIGVVALIVIGPEKLPKVARGAGLLLGKMQRFATTIKSEINSELRMEELQRLNDELRQHDLGLNEALRQGMKPVEQVIKESEELRKAAGQSTDDKDEANTGQQVAAENENVSASATVKRSHAE